jgi:hypothetical protein
MRDPGNGHNGTAVLVITVMPLPLMSMPPCACHRHGPADMQSGIAHPGNAFGNDRKILSTFFVDKSVDETLEKSLRA